MNKIEIINEIHKQARKNFSRRSVILKGIDDLWQADLIDMQKLQKFNNNFKYILVVIDAFSKFAWTVALKSKCKFEMTKAFNCLLDNGRKPSHLQTDQGKEFYNDSLTCLLKKYEINHYSTYSDKKASIVERLIRTLKNKIYKHFHYVGNYKWIGKPLRNITADYNNTVHRTTKFKPIDINSSNNILVMNNIFKSHKKNILHKLKFRVGDFVRISKYKGVFEKGYTPNWSTEIFTITKVNKTNPYTYHVEDQHKQPILGSFYEQELQKTKYPDMYLIEKVIKRNGNKLFVKWLGFNQTHNSWIDKNKCFGS